MTEIYFIECEGRIKIGFSRNASDRAKELATGAPAKLNFLGRVSAPRTLETDLHRRLRNYRCSGEWFRDCDEVRACMYEAIQTGRCENTGFRYPELMAALKRIVGPSEIGTKVKAAIDQAAICTGLPRWRIFDTWYGKARRVEASEALAIRDALIAATSGMGGSNPAKRR